MPHGRRDRSASCGHLRQGDSQTPAIEPDSSNVQRVRKVSVDQLDRLGSASVDPIPPPVYCRQSFSGPAVPARRREEEDVIMLNQGRRRRPYARRLGVVAALVGCVVVAACGGSTPSGGSGGSTGTSQANLNAVKAEIDKYTRLPKF